MAYPPARSANTELMQGMVDGRYKQVIKDRGGDVESGTCHQREELSCVYYGIEECPVFDLPDGRKFVSPYHTPRHHHDTGIAGVY